jgi:hypothetical protein
MLRQDIPMQIPVDSSDESDHEQIVSDDSDEDSPEPNPEQASKAVRKNQTKRVRPVITTVPVIRSSSRVPTSDDESDDEQNSGFHQVGPRVGENGSPTPIDNARQLSPTSNTTAVATEGIENQQDPPRKKRKLGTGLSRRSSHAPLHYTNV